MTFPHVARLSALCLAICGGILGVALVCLWWFPDLQFRARWLALAASFIAFAPVLLAVSGAALLLAARGRQRWLALGAAAGLICSLPFTVPHIPHPPPAGSPTLTVLVLNLRFGKADPAQLLTEVDRAHPDVIVLLEINRQIAGVLNNSPGFAALPHRFGTPGPDWQPGQAEVASGTMIFSRFPLTLLEQAPSSYQQYTLRVASPEPFVLLAGHPTNPSSGWSTWASDHAWLARQAQLHGSEPLVIAGDLNAVAEHAPLRILGRLGLTDAAAQSGAGWQPTWPADVLPVLQIDHVLVNDQLTAVSHRLLRVADTDHLGLVVGLRRS